MEKDNTTATSSREAKMARIIALERAREVSKETALWLHAKQALAGVLDAIYDALYIECGELQAEHLAEKDFAEKYDALNDVIDKYLISGISMRLFEDTTHAI